MVDALTDVEGSILDCKKAIEEFDNELLELNWQIFERIQTQFDNISSELGNLAGLFDDFNDIRVSDGKGTWTKEAIATLGLYAQQYEVARYQVGQYSEAIDKLNQDYMNGRYSATEYMDKLADLSKEQWEAVNAAESLENAIYDLNETRVNEEIKVIEDEIDAYKKLTDQTIKNLEAQKDLHDYQKSIAEKNKSITELENRLAAMANDDSAATIAKRKQLEKQLADARKDLEEYEYDHSIEAQEDALNKQYEKFEEERNKEIEVLRKTLEDREALLSQSFETVKANADLVGQEIAAIAVQHGITVSDAIITSWQSGENAIASYGQVLSAQSSAFIRNLMGVENEVYNLRTQANITADSLAWMFATRADNLVNELTSSYYSEANLNAMTNALQSSLVNTLERGYNISGITSALNSIANRANSVAAAANNAANALSRMGAAQSSSTSNSNRYIVEDSVGNGQYRVIDTTTGKPVSGYYRNEDQAIKYLNKIRGYASGTRNADKLRIVDEEGKELELAKLQSGRYEIGNKGDQILTKEQTDNVYEWSKMTPDELLMKLWNSDPDIQSTIAPSFTHLNQPEIVPYNINNSSISVKYDKLIEINGDINDTKHFLGQMQQVVDKGIRDSWKQLDENRRYNRY